MLKSTSAIAIPPGATIKEQLESRKMSQKEFAQRMGITEKHTSHLINGETQLTQNMALRLESVLGLPAQFWNNLEIIYREKLERVREENELEEDANLARNFPYSEMSKYGWIPETRKTVEKAGYLRKFFEVAKLGLLKELRVPGIAYRKVGQSLDSDYALVAWAQKARIEARNIPTSAINIEKLKNLVPQIRSMTTKDPSFFCTKLIDLLASCGVALVFLPHIGGSFLHGASFYDGNHIVMGLTARGGDADKFWFSFFHELHHIIEGHIDNVQLEDEKQEENADMYAKNTLIPPDKYFRFTSMGTFTRDSIIEFAEDIDVLTGVVVGRLQKDNWINYSWHNDLKVRYTIKSS